jgi:hypothetical protein
VISVWLSGANSSPAGRGRRILLPQRPAAVCKREKYFIFLSRAQDFHLAQQSRVIGVFGRVIINTEFITISYSTNLMRGRFVMNAAVSFFYSSYLLIVFKKRNFILTY